MERCSRRNFVYTRVEYERFRWQLIGRLRRTRMQAMERPNEDDFPLLVVGEGGLPGHCTEI